MLRSLALTNFRSYKTIELSFENNLTVIAGPNAVGKTNLLESVFVASTTKSFRASDTELINTDENYYRIVAQFDEDKVELSLAHNQEGHTKQLRLNNKKQSLRSLLGRNPVTLFEPHDMSLFEGSPEKRRKYLDTVLCQIDPHYAEALHLYKRALKQRNSLLHTSKTARANVSEDELFIWDIQLSEHAQPIVRSRRLLIEELSPVIQSIYNEIAGGKTAIRLVYEPNVDTPTKDILKVLLEHRARDKVAGFTTVGPHRDNFTMAFKTGDIVNTASRGETRTAVLAMKIAEMRLIQDRLHKSPILLLDDVFSELDSNRRQHLMELIARQQTLLTTTEVDDNIPKNSYTIDLSGVH